MNISLDRWWVGRRFGGYRQVVDNDAVAVLEKDHSTVQDLFSRVSRQDEDRPAVLKELLRTLSAHVAAEKQLLVPVLRQHGDEGKALADELGDDHHAIEKLVVLVERRKVNSPDVPDLVTELLDITDRHIAHANRTPVRLPAGEGRPGRAGRPGRGVTLGRGSTALPSSSSPPRHRAPRRRESQGGRAVRPGPGLHSRSQSFQFLTSKPTAACGCERPQRSGWTGPVERRTGHQEGRSDRNSGGGQVCNSATPSDKPAPTRGRRRGRGRAQLPGTSCRPAGSSREGAQRGGPPGVCL